MQSRKRATPAEKPLLQKKKARTFQPAKTASITTLSSSSSRFPARATSSSASSSASSSTSSSRAASSSASILSCFHKSKKITLPTTGLVAGNRSTAPAVRVGPKECSALVQLASETDLIHYSCLGEADVGWGCAYRCLQMILSNVFLFAHSEDEAGEDTVETDRWSAIPNLRRIQVQLVKLRRLKKRDIGGTTWIEPPDVGCFLRSYGLAADDVVFRPGKKEKAFQERLIRHFEVEGMPVMIDDRVKAYCLLGVRLDAPAKKQATDGQGRPSPKVTHVLRFDPHVTQYRVPDRVSGAKWLAFKAAFYSPEWLVLFPHRPSTAQSHHLRNEHQSHE